jgi:hypothetical protein
MSLQRVSISLNLADPGVDPELFVPVFHDWIRRGAVEGLLIDVARYAHVHHGPGIMLVGHEGDYSIDLSEGRPALRYTAKRDLPEATSDAIAFVLGRLLGAAAQAADVSGGQVETGALTVEIRDRLQAPNAPETLATLGEDISEGLSDVLGSSTLPSTLRQSDPRAPFSVRVSVTGSALADAIAAASAAPAA